MQGQLACSNLHLQHAVLLHEIDGSAARVASNSEEVDGGEYSALCLLLNTVLCIYGTHLYFLDPQHCDLPAAVTCLDQLTAAMPFEAEAKAAQAQPNIGIDAYAARDASGRTFHAYHHHYDKPDTSSSLMHSLQDIIYSFIISFRFWIDILHYTLLVAIIDGSKFIYSLATPWKRKDSLNSINVAVDTTPTFFRAFWKHMLLKSTGRIKAGQFLSYAEGMELVKEFLQFASRHTVEELQSFTGKETPTPSWVKKEVVEIPTESLDAAAELLRNHLETDDPGLKYVGGPTWWRLRCRPLYGEWIEMRRDAEKREYARQTGETMPAERVILYLHGGAHYFAGNGTHRYQIQRHARKLAARAFSV